MGRKISGIKALIFDMDGVIVDSEPLHLLAYQELFGARDIPYTEEDNREFLGRKDMEMAHVLVERFQLTMTPAELVQAKERILARLLTEQAVARPGLYKTLESARAKNLHMAVASSATLPTIELVTTTLKVRDYFHNLSSGDEVPNGKPAPDVFLLAAKRLGVDPSCCLVVEDTLNGLRAALAGGMYCVAIPCDATRHQDHSEADLRLQSLDELDLASMLAISSAGCS
ncbi:MAG: HAD family phosphatase [Candidatus Obscuribacterales bacterium]|nr:HAD family phosphatase [Candidatus Obscuribacterales bacterium]